MRGIRRFGGAVGVPCAVAVAMAVAAATCPAGEAPAPFIRGDTNGSATVDIADAVSTLAYLFSGGAGPECLDVLDANDDGQVNVADAVTTLAFLFSGGPPIAAPFPALGYDPSPDALPCAMECISVSEFEAATALGTQVVSVPSPPQTWSLSILGIGLVDVTYNQNDTITIPFGQLDYDPADADLSMTGIPVSSAGSLFVDGPFGLDWSCTATVPFTVSGSIDLAQQQPAPGLILVTGVAIPSNATVNATLGNVSVSSCGFTAIVFDAVYPLVASNVNAWVENQVEAVLLDLVIDESENLIDELVADFEPLPGIPVCAP